MYRNYNLFSFGPFCYFLIENVEWGLNQTDFRFILNLLNYFNGNMADIKFAIIPIKVYK